MPRVVPLFPQGNLCVSEQGLAQPRATLGHAAGSVIQLSKRQKVLLGTGPAYPLALELQQFPNITGFA